MTTTEPAPGRRRYDSPVRRQRAAETRERIVAAGAALLHEHAVWNWDALTVREVAQRAGVNERTVYRHFAGERELRDAVFARLEEEAGVGLYDVDTLTFEGLATFTEQVLRYVSSSFPLEPRSPSDPTLLTAYGRMREGLLSAVAGARPDLPERDRVTVAAVLDALWSVGSFERLVADWSLDPDDAIAGVTWAIGLVEEAIRRGDRPLAATANETGCAP